MSEVSGGILIARYWGANSIFLPFQLTGLQVNELTSLPCKTFFHFFPFSKAKPSFHPFTPSPFQRQSHLFTFSLLPLFQRRSHLFTLPPFYSFTLSTAIKMHIAGNMQKNAHFLGCITHILKKEVLFLQIVSIVLIERHCGENHRHRQHP